MPTNEERREVAARLRALDSDAWSSYREEYTDLLIATKCHVEVELKDRLADLIEPEPERTCKPIQREYVSWLGIPIMGEFCECGHLLEDFGNYCPNCGCRMKED